MANGQMPQEKVVKQTVHGKLLGMREGNKIKKTVGLMKESASAIKHHGKEALRHGKAAEEAKAKGDTKKAEKHAKAAGIHFAERDKHVENYKKLHASIGEHGATAHKHIMEHHRKIIGKHNAKNLPKAEPAKKPGILQRVKNFFSKSAFDDVDVNHFLSNSEDPEYDYLVEAFDQDQDLSSESSASSEAKKAGLHHVGFGRWADKKGKVVKQTVHGKLLGVREGNKVKKTVSLMKEAHKAKKEHVKGYHAHIDAARAANARGDHKEAAKHVKAAKAHDRALSGADSKYKKLASSIGEHGKIADEKIQRMKTKK